LTVTIVASLALTGWFIDRKLIFTCTPSLSHRLFLIRSVSDLKKGDYVVFTLHGDRFAKSKDKLIKRIACADGDFLRVIRKKYYCNGFFLGVAKDTTLSGEKLDNFIYGGMMEKDALFVMGEHKDSYDSRYFGLIQKNQVISKAYPIW